MLGKWSTRTMGQGTCVGRGIEPIILSNYRYSSTKANNSSSGDTLVLKASNYEDLWLCQLQRRPWHRTMAFARELAFWWCCGKCDCVTVVSCGECLRLRAGWRSQRPQSRKVVWQQRRKMARLRLARNRARDRLSRALLRKESVSVALSLFIATSFS